MTVKTWDDDGIAELYSTIATKPIFIASRVPAARTLFIFQNLSSLHFQHYISRSRSSFGTPIKVGTLGSQRMKAMFHILRRDRVIYAEDGVPGTIMRSNAMMLPVLSYHHVAAIADLFDCLLVAADLFDLNIWKSMIFMQQPGRRATTIKSIDTWLSLDKDDDVRRSGSEEKVVKFREYVVKSALYEAAIGGTECETSRSSSP